MGIFLDLRCIYFSLKFFLLAPLFMAFFFCQWKFLQE